MRKIISILLIIILLFSLCSCSKNASENIQSHKPVTINIPKDDSVNGYRISPPKTDNSTSAMPDIISQSDTAVEDENSSSNKENISSKSYCANKNSKVFHLSSCSSVTNMKESNKLISSNRSELISKGYKPCSRCKP